MHCTRNTLAFGYEGCSAQILYEQETAQMHSPEFNALPAQGGILQKGIQKAVKNSGNPSHRASRCSKTNIHWVGRLEASTHTNAVVEGSHAAQAGIW